MKTPVIISALVMAATMSLCAQTSIVTFPESLGTAEYSKVKEVPKEFKDVLNVIYQAEVDGNIVAQYSGLYGHPGLCTFDADMNTYFPPKDWMKVVNRFVGVDQSKQIVAICDSKKGAVVGLFDAKMQLQKSVVINADAYFDKSVASMYVKDGKIYLIMWQFNKKPHCWMGYVLDANTLETLSQTELGTSWHSQFTYSKNKAYMACVAVDDKKGKYLYNPLYNGAYIRLYDQNFTLIQERYVYGNIDDPWVHDQGEKFVKKVYSGGGPGIKTEGEYHVMISDEGVSRYITLDAASAIKITATRGYTIPLHDNRIVLYTLSASRNDSIAISDVLAGEKIGDQSVISVSDDSLKMLVQYNSNQLDWNLKANVFSLNRVSTLVYNGAPNTFQRTLYRYKFDWLLENIKISDKSHISYDIWRSPYKDFPHFPHRVSDILFENKELNGYVNKVMPKENRSLLAYSAGADVYCFLVTESLNEGYGSTPPIETTKPLYIDFFSKEGKLAEFVFPHTAIDMVYGRKAYRSLIDMNANKLDDKSLWFYLKFENKHQWIILHPYLFDPRE